MTLWRCTNCTYAPLLAEANRCPRCSWTVFEPIGDGQCREATSDTDKRAPHHAAADMAHRDDLARDAARLWAAYEWSRNFIDPDLAAALDRLASVYGATPEEKR